MAIPAGIQGLLDTGMLGDIGTGLLASSGYSPVPVTFGQAFGGAMRFANARQGQRLELQAARQKVEQDAQRQKAMTQLQGLLVPPTTPGPVMVPIGPAPINTTQGQQQAMGLLGQIAPEAVAQGLLANQFRAQEPARTNTDYNTFKALNPQLVEGTPEFRSGYQSWVTSNNALDPAEQMRLNEATLAVTQLQAEIAKTQKAEQTEEQLQIVSLNSLARNLLEFRAINNELAATPLATGGTFADQRRGIAALIADVKSVFGEDSQQYQDLITKRDRLEVLGNAIVNQRSEAASAGIGRTDAGRSMLAAEKPGIGLTPAANNMTIDGMLNGILMEGSARDIYIAPEITSQIQAMSGQSYQTPQPTLNMNGAGGLLNINPNAVPPDQIPALLQSLDAQIQQLQGGR